MVFKFAKKFIWFLGKGKVMASTELPIANDHLSLTDRLIKLMNGGPRRFCFVHYDRIPFCSSINEKFCSNAMTHGFFPTRRYADGTTTSADGCGNYNLKLFLALIYI